MKLKTFLIVFCLLLIPFLGLAQTAAKAVVAPTASPDLVKLIKDVLTMVKELRAEVKILQSKIDKMGAPAPKPLPESPGPLAGVSETECISSKYRDRGAFWSAEWKCYIPNMFCPVASTPYYLACPSGQQPEYKKTPPWECFSSQYTCVPIPPTPELTCAAGYELRGKICYNPLSNYAYLVADRDVNMALPLTAFAPKYLGVTRSCRTDEELKLGASGADLECARKSGIITPVKEWIEIIWNTGGLKSKVDPAVPKDIIDSAKIIIKAG